MELYENSYANQKNITVHKENCDENELYAKINLRAMNHAMRDLKANTYKMWCYFAQNQKVHSINCEYKIKKKERYQSQGYIGLINGI